MHWKKYGRGLAMNDIDVEKLLTEYFDELRGTEMSASRVDETIDLFTAAMQEQASPPAEPRQSFWGFLSDVFHFEGKSLLLPQLAVLLVTCHVAFTYSMSAYALPSWMPLFILVVMPTFFRGQYCRVSEVEAATRTSGAQLALARLILAGGGALVCLTFLLALEVWLQRSFENLGRVVIYCLVPYLTCMTTMLALIRRRRKDGAPLCMAIALVSIFFWRWSARLLPWLYEASALGIWIAAVLFYSWLLAKEITYIIHADKEVNMYGIVD